MIEKNYRTIDIRISVKERTPYCCVDLSKELNNVDITLKEISIPFEQDVLNLN